MDDKPTTIQISCLDCRCQEDLELLATEGGYDEARDLALTRAGWEILDVDHARCPRCFTPARLDWLQGLFVLIGLVGTIGIGWLDDRPRIVVAYLLAWGFIGGILPDSLWHRIVNVGKRNPGQWKNPGPWIGRVSYVTWVGGLVFGALDRLTGAAVTVLGLAVRLFWRRHVRGPGLGVGEVFRAAHGGVARRTGDTRRNG